MPPIGASKTRRRADMAALPADRSGIYFARGVHDIGKYIVPAHVKNIYIPATPTSTAPSSWRITPA